MSTMFKTSLITTSLNSRLLVVFSACTCIWLLELLQSLLKWIFSQKQGIIIVLISLIINDCSVIKARHYT